MRDRKEAQAKAKALVAQMTVEEKASQLKYDAPAIERLGEPGCVSGKLKLKVVARNWGETVPHLRPRSRRARSSPSWAHTTARSASRAAAATF